MPPIYCDAGFVMLDIPGLIEGTHAGVGFGDEFLCHIVRTSVLVHVIDGSVDDPVEEYQRTGSLHIGQKVNSGLYT